MSSETTGLVFSSHSPALFERATRKCLRFALLLSLLLLVTICSANAMQAEPAESDAKAAAHSQGSFVLNYGLCAKYAGMLVLFALPAVTWQWLRHYSGQRQKQALKHGPVPRDRTRIPSSAYDEERKRLSRELHDSVGQILTAVGLQLRAIRLKPLSSDQLQMRLDEACRLNGEALRRVRDLAMGLRPALIEDVGLAAALRLQARQLSDHSGIPTFVEVSGELEDLPEDQRVCIYRCVLEALTNCAKHARATSVRLAVHAHDETVDVIVEDDGIGFDLERHFGSGLGLLSMRERVAGVDGKMSIVSRPERGTTLCFKIPVSKGVAV